MAVAASGLQSRTRRRWLVEAVKVLSSMRSAIRLLAVIAAITSVNGTVLKQNAPMPN